MRAAAAVASSGSAPCRPLPLPRSLQERAACRAGRLTRRSQLRQPERARPAPHVASATAADAAAPAAPPGTVVPHRICFMIEPSPFTYICGYMNRYRNTIRYLVEAGCEVLVVTPGKGVTLPGVDFSAGVDQPAEFEGARIVSSFSFGCPWYWRLPLSLGLSPRIYREIKAFKPDLVHCTSPGTNVLAALLYARLLRAPLVFAYHTHVPEYLPRLNLHFLVGAMWAVIRAFHGAAQLTLATSQVMAKELVANSAAPEQAVGVWEKGVCSDTFHPRHACEEMRARLTGGRPEAPLLLSVGRLSHEKNLAFLKGVLERVSGARLAFVGDGPARANLEAHFAGTNTVFTGMLTGQALSAAYASADVFVMPSETETLGFVVLEAMASGLPIVAVRAGGIPDIITRPGRTGLLYEPGDVDAAAAHVAGLLADDARRAELAAAGQQEVARFDWRAATQHLLRVQYPLAIAAAAAFYGRRAAHQAARDLGLEGPPAPAAA